MTGTNDKIRSLFLAALMVLSVLAMTTAFTGTVAAQDRTIGGGNGAPAVVFIEEQVDLSGADASNGAFPGAGSITLTGISGEADGEVIQTTVTDADFSGAAPGGYDLQGEADASAGNPVADVIVRDPSVSNVQLFRGAGNTDPDAEITGASIPQGQGAITVRANWNFANQINPVAGSDSAYVSLLDSQGVVISGEVSFTPGTGTGTGLLAGSSLGGGSPNTVTISSLGSLDTGTYRVAVTGLPDDSYNDAAGATAPSPFDPDRGAVGLGTFDIVSPGETVTLRQTEVTQGAVVTGDVTGNVGETIFVRVRNTSVNLNGFTNANAANVFRSTSEVVNRNASNVNNVNYYYAELELESRGAADFQINTSSFDADSTSTFEVVSNHAQVSANDSQDLTVNAPEVSITSAPSAVVIGEEFDIEGEAPQSDRVKAWVRIGDSYRALQTPGGTQATAQVRGDGTFTIEVDSGSVMNLAGSYRVVVTADEVDDVAALAGAGTANNPMSSNQLNNVNTKTTTSIRAVEGALTATLSSDRIAAGVADEITLSGDALGQGQTIRLYVVGPRGQVTGADGGAVNNVGAADTISVEDQQYEVDIAAFDLRGTYQIAVAAPGRNQQFEGGVGGAGTATNPTFGGQTQSEAMEVIQDQYDQAGSDDVLVTTTVQAQNAQLTIDEFRTNGQVEQGTLELSGQSNRQDETLIFIEVLDENDDIIVSSEGEVNGSQNTWSGSIDLSDVETGTYTLRADDDQASATVEFELVEEVSTPTPTETEETPTPTEEETPTETATETETETETETATATEGETGPGFTLVLALIALIAAALLAVRRNS